MTKYFCIIQMGCYHFNNFPSVHILASFYPNKTSNQNILFFYNRYNHFLPMLCKTYNLSFSSCPLKPNRSVWVIPEFCFSLLSKINYNMAPSSLFCSHKSLQNLVNIILNYSRCFWDQILTFKWDKNAPYNHLQFLCKQ